jgi:hypothetical protein
METIHYRAADVGPQHFISRSRSDGSSDIALFARLPQRRTHVPRFDSTTRQQLIL